MAVLGIGNPLRGDDAVGVEIVRLIKGKVPRNVHLLDCETVPENFLGELEASNPTHVLLIDAADFQGEAGEARLVSPSSIVGLTLSTHAISLSLLAKVISDRTGADVMVLGVQPARVEFGEQLTPGLKRASRRVARTLMRVLMKTGE